MASEDADLIRSMAGDGVSYRGFSSPTGMDEDQARSWKDAIDVSEDDRELKDSFMYQSEEALARGGRYLFGEHADPKEESRLQDRFDFEPVRGEPEFVSDLREGELRKVGYDPIGSTKRAKTGLDEMLHEAAGGDAVATRNLADIASFKDPSGASDLLSALASARLAYGEPERRRSHLIDVGISGAAAAIPLVGSGLLKSIVKGAPEAVDVAKAEKAAVAPVFESVLEKAVVENMPNKIGVDDVEQFLNKKGAKKSEIVDTKVPEFVAAAKAAGKKSVTKDELIQHLDDNKVQIEEVRLAIQDIPDDIKALSEKSTEAFNDLYDDSLSLAEVLAPGMSVSDQMHKFSDNVYHFDKLYVDYVGGIDRIERFNHDVPDDVFDITSRLINLGRDRSISMWRPEDAALITEARNTINAKLADPEYVKSINEKNFWVGPENEAMRTMDEFEFQRITDEAIEARAHHSNLTTIARILNEMPEAETRLAALRKFQELPNYKKYAALTYDYNEKYRVFQGEARQLPQWGNYTVPGGKDYQEILLTVPQKVTQDFRSWHKSMLDRTMGGPQTGTGPDAFSYDSLPKDMQKADRATYRSETDKEAFLHSDFTESHFRDIPNVMAHIRFKTRIDSKGRKILFVEEIQSDWHQKGLKQGYQGQKIKLPDDVESAIQKMESTKKSVDAWKAANPRPPNYRRGFEVMQGSGLDVFDLMLPEKVGPWKKTLSKEDLDAYNANKSWSDKAYGVGTADPGELATLVNTYHASVKGVEVSADTIGLRLHVSGGTIRRSGGGMPQSEVPHERIRDEFAEHLSGGSRVPDAPLKDTKEWAALAIKRIFREAADGGYDGVAFSRADMITPLVTLPGDEAVKVIGNPEAFMARLADLKQQGGHYAEGAEEAEKVFKGNQYFYDKLLLSIAKKESKAKQGTTLVELEDVGFSSIRDPEYPTNTAEFFDTPDGRTALELLTRDRQIIEVPFFELTKEVKNKVIKPQKLYSVALPGVAIGAAAAGEEELSAAAAIGAIGMGVRSLYRGAKGARGAARGADVAKPKLANVGLTVAEEADKYFEADQLRIWRKASKDPKSREALVYMTPDEFLGMAEPTFIGIPGKQVPVDELLKEGAKFNDVPFLKFDNTGRMYGHEGRHRAMALKKIGVDRVPVRLWAHDIRWGEQRPFDPSKGEPLDYRENLPETLIGEDGVTAMKSPFFTEGPNRGAVRPEYTGDVKVGEFEIGPPTRMIGPAPVFEGFIRKLPDRDPTLADPLPMNPKASRVKDPEPLDELRPATPKEELSDDIYSLMQHLFGRHSYPDRIKPPAAADIGRTTVDGVRYKSRTVDAAEMRKDLESQGHNIEELRQQGHSPLQGFEDYEPRVVNIDDIPTGGDFKVRDPERVRRATKFIESGEEMTPPQVGLDADGKIVSISDGVHRIAALRKAGKKQIVVDTYKPAATDVALPPFDEWVEAHLKPRKEGTVYWEDMDEAAKVASKSQRKAEIDVLFETDFPFKAEFAGEDVTVLGPQARFHPPEPDGSFRKTQWVRIERPDGSRADTVATSILKDGKPLVSALPPGRQPKVRHTGFGSAMGQFKKQYETLAKKAPKPAAADVATAAAKTDTPEFKTWFGKSKVVDEAGEPLVVHHGTTGDFDSFKPGSPDGGFGSSHYFSNNIDDVNLNYANIEGPDIAARLARGEVVGDPQFSVIPAYLKMENPVYLDPSGKKGRTVFNETGSADQLLEAIDDVAVDFYKSSGSARKLKDFVRESLERGELDAMGFYAEAKRPGRYYFNTGGKDRRNTEFIRRVFEKMGFDGIIADADNFFGPSRGIGGTPGATMKGVTPGTYHYMPFDPTQIKSATGNIGTFDPTDPSILKGIGVGAAVPAAAAVRSQKEDGEGNPAPELDGGPFVYTEARDYAPVSEMVSVMRDSQDKYEDLLSEMNIIEAEYASLTKEERSGDRGRLLEEWHEKTSDEYSEIGDFIDQSAYTRFLMGSDVYFDTEPTDIRGFDERRGFTQVGLSDEPLTMDISLRRKQENVQRSKLQKTVESGGPYVDFFGELGDLNKYLYKKASFFSEPVQTVQLTGHEKRMLHSDEVNLKRLYDSGLISYLLYKESVGDVELL
jgi:hypothetical protein